MINYVSVSKLRIHLTNGINLTVLVLPHVLLAFTMSLSNVYIKYNGRKNALFVVNNYCFVTHQQYHLVYIVCVNNVMSKIVL